MSRAHPLAASAATGEALTGQPRFAFSDRAHGNTSLLVGDGDAHSAREGLAGLVGVQPGDLVFMEQVHGGAVAVVGTSERGRGLAAHADTIAGVDALITAESHTALVVLTADCVPVLMAADGVVAAVHAGREGLRADVLQHTVQAFAAFGIAAEAIHAVLGPAIAACCYEVPADLAAQLDATLPNSVGQTTWGTPSADLPSATVALLQRAGVRHIERSAECTRCAPERWFSHRAATDGRSPSGAPGRQASVVMWQSTEMSTSGLRGHPDGLA